MELVKKLIEAVKEGDDEAAVVIAKQIVEADMQIQPVINELTELMRDLGKKFEALEIFLPEMIISADAMVAAMEIFEPKMVEQSGTVKKKGIVAMGTAAGDMHEIGKNIVCTVLKADGFEVHDLGRDVKSHDFVKKAQELNADIIGISSLMTTTMPPAKEVIDILKEKGIYEEFKVMVGGAPTNPVWAKEIGAAAWGENSAQAVDLANKLVRGENIWQ